MVDDLDDGGELARVGVIPIDENDTANLNKAPGGTLDQCFAHCVVVCERNSRSVRIPCQRLGLRTGCFFVAGQGIVSSDRRERSSYRLSNVLTVGKVVVVWMLRCARESPITFLSAISVRAEISIALTKIHGS